MPDEKPIRLMSHISGLAVRVKPGSQERIEGSNRFLLKHGEWLFFQNGTRIVRPAQYAKIWGTREEAVKAIRALRRFGKDFQILPDTIEKPAREGASGRDSAPRAEAPDTPPVK